MKVEVEFKKKNLLDKGVVDLKKFMNRRKLRGSQTFNVREAFMKMEYF